MRIDWLVLILSVVLSSSALADTIILRSGKTVEGKITEQTTDHVKVNFHGLDLTYYSDEIEKISKASPDPAVTAAPVAAVEQKIIKEEPPPQKDPDLYALSQLESVQQWAVASDKRLYFILYNESFNFANYNVPDRNKGVFIGVGPKDNNAWPKIIQQAVIGLGGSISLPATIVVDPQMTKVIKIITVMMVKPRNIPVGDSFILGKETAPVTLTMFCDYQCPFCRVIYPQIMSFINSNPDLVRLVIKHYPLPFHEDARKAAKAALCAGAQGKFFAMSALILQNQTELKKSKFVLLAQQAGLDALKFMSDYETRDKEWDDKINADIQLADGIQVRGTPTFFLNGYPANSQMIDTWRGMIDQILQDPSGN